MVMPVAGVEDRQVGCDPDFAKLRLNQLRDLEIASNLALLRPQVEEQFVALLLADAVRAQRPACVFQESHRLVGIVRVGTGADEAVDHGAHDRGLRDRRTGAAEHRFGHRGLIERVVDRLPDPGVIEGRTLRIDDAVPLVRGVLGQHADAEVGIALEPLKIRIGQVDDEVDLAGLQRQRAG